MVSKKIAEILKNVRPIPKELGKKIMDIGTITGSLVFGDKTMDDENIDIDILIPTGKGLRLGDIRMYIAYDDDYNGEDFKSCYVKTEKGTVLNLIFVWEKERFDKWVYATNLCKELYECSDTFRLLLQSKKKRIHLFEIFKEV